jgi:hypothetical protein
MSVIINGTTGIDTVQDNTVTSAKIVNASIVTADAATGVALSGTQTGTAPFYGCRAYCVFDGTLTGTNAPTAGGNVTSVTRNGTGDYTINFTTAMPDANYAVCLAQTANAAANTGANVYIAGTTAGGATLKTTTQLEIQTFINTTAVSDYKFVSVVIFR